MVGAAARGHVLHLHRRAQHGGGRPSWRSRSSCTSSAPGTAACSWTLTRTRSQRIKSCLTEPQFAEAGGRARPRRRRARARGSPAGTCLPHRVSPRRRAERRVEAIVDSFASALAVGRAQQPCADAHHPGDRRADRARRRSCPRSCSRRSFRSRRSSGTPSGCGRVLPFLSPPRRQFFTERFPRLSEEAITPGHEPDRPAALLHPARRAARRTDARPTTSPAR